MPGRTARYGLPYLLPTEGLHKIADVTRLFAERLEQLVSEGVIGGGNSEPAKPPTASVVMAKPHKLPGWQTYTPTWEVETDVNSPRGRQASKDGLTVRQTGMYLVTCQFPWEDYRDAAAHLQLKLYSGEHQVAEATNISGPGGWESIGVISTLLPLPAGTTLSVKVIHSGSQDSAKAIKVGGTVQGGLRTRLAMTLITT